MKQSKITENKSNREQFKKISSQIKNFKTTSVLISETIANTKQDFLITGKATITPSLEGVIDLPIYFSTYQNNGFAWEKNEDLTITFYAHMGEYKNYFREIKSEKDLMNALKNNDIILSTKRMYLSYILNKISINKQTGSFKSSSIHKETYKSLSIPQQLLFNININAETQKYIIKNGEISKFTKTFLVSSIYLEDDQKPIDRLFFQLNIVPEEYKKKFSNVNSLTRTTLLNEDSTYYVINNVVLPHTKKRIESRLNSKV